MGDGRGGAAPARSRKSRQRVAWSDVGQDLDWQAGQVNDLAPGFADTSTPTPQGSSESAAQEPEQAQEREPKRARQDGWKDRLRSFSSLFQEHGGRVEACWEQSEAIHACQAQARALYSAMALEPIQDNRLSVAGEQARIRLRAAAMKRVLEQQDPGARVGGWGVHEDDPPPGSQPASATPPPHAQQQQQQQQQQQPKQQQPKQQQHGARKPEQVAPPTRAAAAAAAAAAPAAGSSKAAAGGGATAAGAAAPAGAGGAGAMPDAGSAEAAAAAQQAAAEAQAAEAVRLQRSSNEAEPEASADDCVLSVCLLMAALYEQTPFGETELRRRVYDDFSQLKRHFRHDELLTLHGRTSTIGELFGSIKALDRRSGLQNLLGIMFEDWQVNKRVDPFIMADQITVQVTALTLQGPIGKFGCRMRTFATLCLLHDLLLKELYLGVFAGKSPPRGNMEMMTRADPLDYVDFVEAMARNPPFQHRDDTQLFYAWMYAPEVNATTETWQAVFGQKHNALPALYDGVQMPDGLINHMTEDGDYSLNLDVATENDLREQGSSQTPVAFPWSDDLLGEFLRRVRKERQAKAGQPPCSRADGKAAQGGAAPPGGSGAQPDTGQQNPDEPHLHAIPNAEQCGRLVLPLGIFLVGIICSGANTNTQIHIEDLLLMSININMFGAPKVWYWVPQESAQEFKWYVESMTEGGRKELYTKSISPFLQDVLENPPQPTLPLRRLKAMGVRRTIQLPGMGILTMPGYAFHFTVSQGLNVAESCNMFLEVMGWTFEKLWKARPLEQYPSDVDDMARYMRDTGVLSRLGVPNERPLPPRRVHRALRQHNLGHARVASADGGQLQRYVTPNLVKYVALPPRAEGGGEGGGEDCRRLVCKSESEQQPIIVIM